MAVEPVQAMHYETPLCIVNPYQPIEVDTLPSNFMPTSYSPQPGTPTVVADPLDGNPSRPSTASPKPLYVPAPVPPTVVYPDPPAYPLMTRAPSAHSNRTSSRARSRSDSLAGRLSPLPFGTTFQGFAPSDD